MSVYIYVVAAAIAIFPILIAFKVIVDRVKSEQITYEKGLTQFFLTTGIIEIIPILLVVYGFSQNASADGLSDVLVPALLVVVFMGVGAFFIFLQAIVGVPKEQKQRLMTFSVMALALTNAIPIVCLVGLFTMLA